MNNEQQIIERLDKIEDIIFNSNKDILFLPFSNIRDFIEVVSSVPSSVPATLYEQIKIYNDGTTKKLYLYDYKNRVWLSVKLT